MNLMKMLLLMMPFMVFTFFACQENNDKVKVGTDNQDYSVNEKEIAFEKIINDIDLNDSLKIGNSLYYSRPDGASTEAIIFIDEENQTVKIIEKFTLSGAHSLGTNIFYLNDGKKLATIQRVEEGEGDEAHFVERVSYYDEEEKPIFTKQRTAPYEEDLDKESFEMAEKQDCSMARVIEVLNQSGNFATTFRGFVKDESYLYLIVGEDDMQGYSSSLVVQYIDRTIRKLQENEIDMVGKPLIIEFEKLAGEQGFEYQILLSAALR